MKKQIICIAVLTLVMTLFVSSAPAEMVTGGWTVTETEAAVLPEEVRVPFEKAVGELDGAEYRPVALLGSQVVAGANYCILCQIVPVVPDPVPSWALVYLYVNPQGESSILNVYELYIDRHAYPAEE